MRLNKNSKKAEDGILTMPPINGSNIIQLSITLLITKDNTLTFLHKFGFMLILAKVMLGVPMRVKFEKKN